jgi:hypothetical protein
MSAHTLSQTPTTVRQIVIRYRWTLALSFLSVVTALAVYRFTSVPTVVTPAVSGSQVSHIDPTQQSVLDYLRAHQTIAETHALDPTQQSVMSYLLVHSSVGPLPAPAVSLEPAQQSVLYYLRAHAAGEIRPVDPTQQGVMDYLRTHSQ